jgi:hypothetical protein
MNDTVLPMPTEMEARGETRVETWREICAGRPVREDPEAAEAVLWGTAGGFRVSVTLTVASL